MSAAAADKSAGGGGSGSGAGGGGGEKYKDVYQTEDLPVVEEKGNKTKAAEKVKSEVRAEEKKNEDIVEMELRPQLAFEKFAGKVFDPRVGEAAPSPLRPAASEFVSLPHSERRFESPFERFMRLKDELASFQKDLQALAEASKVSDQSTAQAAAALTRELAAMEQSVAAMSSNQAFRPFLASEFVDPDLLRQKSLLDQLVQQLERAGSGSGAAPAAAAADKKPDASTHGGRVVYELFYNPQKEAARRLMNLVDIDRRITGLERTLGAASDERNLGFSDVYTAINSIRRRMELLDQSKLDQVYRRVRTLMSELDLLESQKARLQGPDATKQDEKINQLFDMMTKWDEAAQLLPSVIARLQSLRDVHEESAQAVLRMQDLEAQQAQMRTLLQQDHDALQAASQSLASNMKTMTENVRKLHERVEALSTKIARLK
jgi:chromosome segregation ATPase